jgi:hypothetical protein
MIKAKTLILIALLGAVLASPAHARQDWPFGWWPGHWKWVTYKNFNPYLEKGKQTQNQQWGAEDWYVQDWVSQYENEFKLIDGFFKSDVLREQTDEDDVPVLIVGPNFYRLGGFDKRRVLTTLDAVYGITERGTHPVILLRDWHTNKEIGLFTKDGLQME